MTLHSKTIPDRHSLPKIQNILKTLRKGQYFKRGNKKGEEYRLQNKAQKKEKVNL